MSDIQKEIEEHLIGSLWYEGLTRKQKTKIVEVAMREYKGDIREAIIQAHHICVINRDIPKPPIVRRDVFDDRLREEDEEINNKYERWGKELKKKGVKTRRKREKKTRRKTRKVKGKNKR
jgi:hypothetical protein